MIFPSGKRFGFLVVLLFVSFLVNAKEVPGKSNRLVNDYAGILSSSEREVMEAKLDTFEKYTDNQITIVLDSSLEGESLEKYSARLFNTWGIGQKDKNNGILIYAAMKDRKVQIETGTGLEKYVSNATCADIIDNYFTPAFKKGSYYLGLEIASFRLMIASSNADTAVPGNLGRKNAIVKNTWGDVETAYQRRSDIAHNLVPLANNEAGFDKSIIKDMKEAFTLVNKVYKDPHTDPFMLTVEGVKNFQDAQDTLGKAIAKFISAMENYPALKANRNFKTAVDELGNAKNRIVIERKKYNDAGKEYNETLKRNSARNIPQAFGYTPVGYFAPRRVTY